MDFASGDLDGLREVARTLCPWASTVRARASPNPEEHPVMSQVKAMVREDWCNTDRSGWLSIDRFDSGRQRVASHQ